MFAARAACAAVAGEPASLASGALHDAAEVARVLPAVMVFAPSHGGISHAREEDTAEADLAVAIEAFAELAARLLERELSRSAAPGFSHLHLKRHTYVPHIR